MPEFTVNQQKVVRSRVIELLEDEGSMKTADIYDRLRKEMCPEKLKEQTLRRYLTDVHRHLNDDDIIEVETVDSGRNIPEFQWELID